MDHPKPALLRSVAIVLMATLIGPAHAAPLTKRPLPESVVLRREAWQPLAEGLEQAELGQLVALSESGARLLTTGCLTGSVVDEPVRTALSDALAAGVMHPPPQGKSWAEGPILQVAYGAPAIRRSPPEARLTDLCEDALRGLPEGERRNTALVVGVLDADVVATSCGRMDPMFKALPKKLATCEDRTGQRVVLGAVLKSAEVLLPPKAGATGPEIRPWSTPPDAPAALLDPTLATQTAPDSFDVAVESTAGPFLLRVTRSWSPHGADRFYNLVQLGFYNEASFFRVVEGFVAQTGISAYPDVAAAWFGANIPDDPVTQSNTQGRVSFATAGPGTRTTQLFICLEDVAQLDGMGFSPFAEVVEGMDAVKRLYADYGEGAPMGSGPDQERIQAWGGAYLEGQFPKLDRILTARVVAPAP